MILMAGCQAQFQSVHAKKTQNSFAYSDDNKSIIIEVEKDGNEEKQNNYKDTEAFCHDSTSIELIVIESLESWIGGYRFEEVGIPTHHCMEYNVAIYSENGKCYANISIDGWLTEDRFKAQVIGDDKFIKLVFYEYLPDSHIPEYAQIEIGDILLSFERKRSDLLTYWGRIES
jgi:hypothetical protein